MGWQPAFPGTPASAASPSLAASMQQMIPIFIPSFNNPTYLRGMLDQLHARGLSNIIVVDNASTLPEMQALLESDLGVTVVRLDRNAGPRSIFLDDDNYALLPDLFCVTDPDLELNPGLPPDFLARLAGLTERFQIGKAGFSLDISDRESLRQETFDMGWDSRYTIWDWEQQFWVNPVGELDDLGTIYRATIDTTFSVYNKRYFRRDQYMDAVRVAGMFTCRHLPWYKEATIPRLEAETYRATSQYSCYPPEEPAADEASGETDEGGGDWQETPSLGEAILGVPARDVLVIVPTRSRPENAAAFAEAFVSNSRRSDLLFGLDEDDAHNYPRLPGVMYEVNPRLRLNGTLNLIAKKYMDRYEYIAFMGDDHRVRTPGWDELLVEAIVDVPHGIAYGNDLYQGANLPTAVLMKSSIIRRIGYMTPPQLTHLCLDDFWLDLGQSLGSIRYIDSVIIEHLHPSIGKANYDGSYLETNTNEMYERDLAALARYKNERFALDIALLQGNMTRLRLRPPYSETELRQIYATPHQHTRWADHRIRVGVTTEIAKWFADAQSVADLSAGDAAIINELEIPNKFIGDFAPGYGISGPIEKTVDDLEPVDLFICSEILEHLDDPDLVLRKIRAKAKYLVLSTPVGEIDNDNPEHYWGWDAAAIEAMLVHAGFTPVVMNVLGFRERGYPYDFQIWACR